MASTKVISPLRRLHLGSIFYGYQRLRKALIPGLHPDLIRKEVRGFPSVRSSQGDTQSYAAATAIRAKPSSLPGNLCANWPPEPQIAAFRISDGIPEVDPLRPRSETSHSYPMSYSSSAPGDNMENTP